MEITILVALFLIFTTIIYLSSLATIILLLLILFRHFRQLDSFQRPTVSNTDKKNEWGIPPEWGWGENNAEALNHIVNNETAHITHEDGWYSDNQQVPNHLHYLFGETTSPGKILSQLHAKVPNKNKETSLMKAGGTQRYMDGECQRSLD